MPTLLERAQRLGESACAELKPSGNERSTALARFELHFGISADQAALLHTALLELRHPTLEAEALACNRAVAWEREQPASVWPPGRPPPWLMLDLETFANVKLSDLRPGDLQAHGARDWRAEYEALPPNVQDRLRKKASRAASARFMRGAPPMRAHWIIVHTAQVIQDAVATSNRVRAFRARTTGSRHQLSYLSRPVPFSRRDGSPAWDLLLTSLRWALPINTTISGGLPERSIARVLERL